MNKRFAVILAVGTVLIFTFALLAHASFADVQGHKYQAAIDFIQSRNIVSGYPDGTYRPDNQINRAELLTIIVGQQYKNLPTANCFSDVFSNEWYAKFVCKGQELGFAAGYSDGSFKPANYVNFVEALIMLQRAHDIPVDTSIGQHWYDDSIRSAQEMNIIPPDIYDYGTQITRAQMAEMMTRILKYEENGVKSVPTLVTLTKGMPNTCTTLMQNGSPEEKIDVVFIPESQNMTFEEYKNFIEGFFKPEASYPNFLNRDPFAKNLNQFNFYSIWKDDYYGCESDVTQCREKFKKLAAACPIKSAYDNITIVSPNVSLPTGSKGWDSQTECTSSPFNFSAERTLSNGEIISYNQCPGISQVGTYTTDQGYTGILHEWGHMIGGLPHPIDRPTVMSIGLPNKTSYFDDIEIKKLCERISAGSDITVDKCINGN